MKILNRMLEFFKKIFYKKQPKMLEEPCNEVENIGNISRKKFLEQLKVKNSEPVKIETTICVQNGLGFEGKIKE